MAPLSNGEKPIGCKWVFKITYKNTCEIEWFKARIIAKGYNQQEEIDYHETFSPVVKMVTMRSILAISSIKHWHIYQMDVYNVSLQGDLNDEIYMYLP